MKRPYLDFSTDQLYGVYSKSSTDLATLKLLYYELANYRTTTACMTLQEKVERALSDLESGAKASKTSQGPRAKTGQNAHQKQTRASQAKAAAGSSPRTPTPQKIVQCGGCGKSLRIPLRKGDHGMNCRSCKTAFKMSFDDNILTCVFAIGPARDTGGAMGAKQACAILGVGENASKDAIAKARRAMLLKYHPDKVASLGPKLQALASSETQSINAAYDLLTTRL